MKSRWRSCSHPRRMGARGRSMHALEANPAGRPFALTAERRSGRRGPPGSRDATYDAAKSRSSITGKPHSSSVMRSGSSSAHIRAPRGDRVSLAAVAHRLQPALGMARCVTAARAGAARGAPRRDRTARGGRAGRNTTGTFEAMRIRWTRQWEWAASPAACPSEAKPLHALPRHGLGSPRRAPRPPWRGRRGVCTHGPHGRRSGLRASARHGPFRPRDSRARSEQNDADPSGRAVRREVF